MVVYNNVNLRVAIYLSFERSRPCAQDINEVHSPIYSYNDVLPEHRAGKKR